MVTVCSSDELHVAKSKAIHPSGDFVNHWEFRQSSSRTSEEKPENIFFIKYDQITMIMMIRVPFAAAVNRLVTKGRAEQVHGRAPLLSWHALPKAEDQ